MHTQTIVVLQSDPFIAQALAGKLSSYFESVHVARNVHELRTAVPRYRAEAAILDIEVSCLSEIERLHRDFPQLAIVCTHRVADEEMWASALNAGASDMFPSSDTQGIVQSTMRTLEQAA
jgi:DNA-binding NarL/FixJ family response regulator